MAHLDQQEGDEPELDALDELDYDDGHYENRTLKYVTFTFVIAAIGGFVALAWYAYQNGTQPVSEGDIPVVEAQNSPLKETPENPGGLQFDHQDKAVYNQLAGNDSTAPRMTEQLLAPPEQPVERPSADATQNITQEPVNKDASAPTTGEVPNEAAVAATDAAKTETGGEVVLAPAADAAKAEPAAGKVESVAVPPVNVAAAPAEETKVTTVASAKDEEKTMEVIEEKPVQVASVDPKPAPKTAEKKAASGSYLAQLGAFRSEADAQAAWAKVSKAHGGKFSGQSHFVQRADLGAKGVFYRLQMGTFASDAAAREACGFLQAQKQACIVVKQ